MSDNEPQPGVGAWVPDPGGRHQLRWWDGRVYTAVVADHGVRGIDPLPPGSPAPAPAPAPAPPAPLPRPVTAAPPLTSASPTMPAWGQVPVAGAPAGATGPDGPVGAERSGRRRWLLVLGGVVVAVVVGVAAAATLVGDEILGDDGGTGSFEGQVAADELGSHGVSVGATQVLIATVVPDGEVDAVVGLLVDAETASLLEELYGGLAGPTDPAEAFDAASGDAVDELVGASGAGSDAQVVFRSDLGFAGDEEALLLLAGADIDATAVVGPFGDASGGYTIEIERFDLELTAEEVAEADGVELLEAVIASREVPSRVINLASDLLELLEEQQEEP